MVKLLLTLMSRKILQLRKLLELQVLLFKNNEKYN